MAYRNIISKYANTSKKKLLKIIFQKTNKAHLYLVRSTTVKDLWEINKGIYLQYNKISPTNTGQHMKKNNLQFSKAYRKWNVSMQDVINQIANKGYQLLKILGNINPICGTISFNSIQNVLSLFICLLLYAVLLSWDCSVLLNGTFDLSVLKSNVGSKAQCYQYFKVDYFVRLEWLFSAVILKRTFIS